MRDSGSHFQTGMRSRIYPSSPSRISPIVAFFPVIFFPLDFALFQYCDPERVEWGQGREMPASEIEAPQTYHPMERLTIC